MLTQKAVLCTNRGVSLQGLNVFRFANRIPLLFEPGSDVVVKQAMDIDWGRYKIDKATAKLGIFVSVRGSCSFSSSSWGSVHAHSQMHQR